MDLAEAEQSTPPTVSSESDSDSSQQDIESVCKDICLAESIRCSGKRLLVRIEGKLLRFRVDKGADVSLIDEPSWKGLGEQTVGVITDRLRNVFKGAFTGATQSKL